jgi:hypothetical protein
MDEIVRVKPVDAANAIRDEFKSSNGELNHQVRFAMIVCDHLGVPHTPENTANVMRLLSKHDIEGTTYEPFPGWFTNDRGEVAICDNEKIREAFMSRPEPLNPDGTSNPASGSIDAHSKFHPAKPGDVAKPVTPPPVEFFAPDAPATKT